MGPILITLWWAIQIYVFIMLARVILDLVMVFSRDWRPTGFLLVIANLVYGLTDPPLKLIGRYIPPLRLGQINLDMGFLVLFIGLQVIQRFILMAIVN